MAVLVDSCVLLDVFTNDPEWSSWSVSTTFGSLASGLMGPSFPSLQI